MAEPLSSSLPSSQTLAADPTAMPSAFRRAHCMADGELTPPDSPDAPVKPTLRNGPRLQLPRLLRRTKTDDQSHLAVRRSSPVRPFVNEMKTVFPLRLPDSPVASDRSSFSSTSPVSPPGLRRRSPTYHDLRSLAAKQKEKFSAQVGAPLLPSPIEKDDMVQSDSYFTFKNPRPRPAEYRSYQDLHILSCYEEREKAKGTINDATPTPDVDQWKSVHPPSAETSDSRSVSSVDTPTTPEEQIYRIGTYCSDESGWLANETSCIERETKLQARHYQVVQQPPTSDSKEGDITVVRIAGPGKPKLVQISRPSSMSTACASRRESTMIRPQTPPRTTEVSAFSPYDTPYTPIDHEASIDTTPLKPRLRVSVPHDKHKFSTCSLIPAPLEPRSIPSTPSDHSSSTAFSSTQERLAQLSDPYGSISPQSHRTIGTESIFNSSTATISTSAWPIPPRNILRRTQHTRSPAISHPAPTSSSTTQHSASTPSRLTALQTRLRRLRHTLSSITAAINGFPNDIIRLDSDVLRPIRNSQISDTTYTDAFAKIFPNTKPILRSALAAWLIIDLWFEKNIRNSPHCNATLTASDLIERSHAPEFWNAGSTPRAYCYSDSGLSPDPESSSIHSAATTPSAVSDFDQFVAWDAAEHSNSALKRIPTKARSLLGISDASLLDENLLRSHEAALIRRMRVLRPIANVVGQRLVENLRGEWDLEIWKCLRVMVEVIEDSPGVGLGSALYDEFDAPGPAVATCTTTSFDTSYYHGPPKVISWPSVVHVGRGLGINA